ANMHITDAEKLRDEPAHHTDYEAARDRLIPAGFEWKLQEFLSQPQQQAAKRGGNKSSKHAKNGIQKQFHRITAQIVRNSDERVVAKQGAQGGPGSCGSEDDGTEYGSVQVADGFLPREQNRSKRGVERSGYGCGSAGRNQNFYFLRTKAEFSS